MFGLHKSAWRSLISLSRQFNEASRVEGGKKEETEREGGPVSRLVRWGENFTVQFCRHIFEESTADLGWAEIRAQCSGE